MQKIILSKFNKLNVFKLIFMNLIKDGEKNLTLDFSYCKLNSDQIFSFLDRYKNSINIKINNLPFCLNKYSNYAANEYRYSLSDECLFCSYAENCKGSNGVGNTSKIITESAALYKKRIKTSLFDIIVFLNELGFKDNEIVIGGNKGVLGYFLFDGYDMFYNGLSDNYFYISEHDRIYVYLNNHDLSDSLFLNEGKNLIFKDSASLAKYLELINNLGLDIIFYSGNIHDMNFSKKTYVYRGKNIDFYADTEIEFKGFFNYEKQDLPESDKQDDFIGKKKIIFNGKNKIELEAINIYKGDYSKLPEKFVLVGKDTTPKHLNEIIKSECILLERSTDISHGAIMSRELKKDCIYGISGIADNISSGDILEIDFDTLEITKT